MAVKGLDHINIVTSDIDGTKQFYRELLGLVDGDTSGMPPGVQAHWLADPAGYAISTWCLRLRIFSAMASISFRTKSW